MVTCMMLSSSSSGSDARASEGAGLGKWAAPLPVCWHPPGLPRQSLRGTCKADHSRSRWIRHAHPLYYLHASCRLGRNGRIGGSPQLATGPLTTQACRVSMTFDYHTLLGHVASSWRSRPCAARPRLSRLFDPPEVGGFGTGRRIDESSKPGRNACGFCGHEAPRNIDTGTATIANLHAGACRHACQNGAPAEASNNQWVQWTSGAQPSCKHFLKTYPDEQTQ